MIALVEQQSIIEEITLLNKETSSLLLPTLDTMLSKKNSSFSAVSYIAVHTGPAPFSSLRSVLATVNGLGYAGKVPLIGIPGLPVFVNEYSFDTDYTIVLLNAYCGQVYYAIRDKQEHVCIGCELFEIFCTDLVPQEGSITFLGQGLFLYRDILVQKYYDRCFFYDAQYLSLSALIQAGYKEYEHQKILGKADEYRVEPVYLKEYSTPLGRSL
jgi:tRNA threonylcarbamoyl adenosine modification protein YeaZ